MGSLSTKAQLLARGNAAAIVLTDEQVATVGEGAKRFPVVATRATRPSCGSSSTPSRARWMSPRRSRRPSPATMRRAAFEKLSYTQRKEHARRVAEAKKDETRDRRVAKTIESSIEGGTG